MVNIRQMLVTTDKYGVKCPYNMNPKGICIHNTANDASANNEVSYMRSNNNEVSFHYAIDDTEIVQGLPENRNAWAAGDGGNGDGNRNYIHLEICYSKSGGSKFDKAEENAADLVVHLLKKYGWGIDKVKKHQDFSGKYCPHRTLDKGWQRFLNMVQARLNPTTPTPQPSGDLCRILVNGKNIIALTGLQKCIDYVKANYPKEEVKIQRVSDNKILWTQAKYVAPTPTDNSKTYKEDGIFYFTTAVQIRTQPKDGYETGLTYYVGENVRYHSVILNKNGFNWIVYTRSNGSQGYIKIKDLSNGESYGYAR